MFVSSEDALADDSADYSEDDQIELTTHSFVMKLWREEYSQIAGHARWRGYITHIPGGERRHVQRLNEIAAFIAPYLEQMGIRLDLSWRLCRWLDRRRGQPDKGKQR